MSNNGFGHSLALRGLVVFCLCLSFASPAFPQSGRRRPRRPQPILIKVKKAHTAKGEVISPAMIMVYGTKIMAIKESLPVRPGMKVVDLSQMEAIPALVDPMATTFLDPGDRQGSIITDPATMAKGLGLIRPDQAADLIRSGVTALGLMSSGSNSSTYIGAGIRRDGRSILARKPGTALVLTFSASGSTADVAKKKWLAFQKTFSEAKKYKEKKEEAAEKLEEYDKKWKKYIETLDKARKAKEKKSGKGKKTGKPAPGKATRKVSPKPGKTPAKTRPAPKPRKVRKPLFAAAEKKKVTKPTPKKTSGTKPTAKKPTGKDKKASKNDRPERPKRFKEDPTKEIYLKAMEGKIRVAIRAHDKDEIHFALMLARQFELKILLVDPFKASDDDRKEIAGKKIPLLFGPADRPLPGELQQGFTTCMIGRWAKLGCPIALGTMGHMSPRFLREQVAHAIATGLPRKLALAAMTSTAAQIAGLDKDYGVLARGKRADILFFAGDPLDPSNAPQRILNSGRFVGKEEQR